MTTTDQQGKERRRLVEHFTTAAIAAKGARDSLLSAGIFNMDPERKEKIALAQHNALMLEYEIADLLRKVQGE